MICFEKGIPYSQWLEWDPADRARFMAYQLESQTRCSLCGTAPWEWEENRFAYEPEEHFCKGCYVKQTFADSQEGRLRGTTVELVPATPERTAKAAVLAEKRREKMRVAKEE